MLKAKHFLFALPLLAFSYGAQAQTLDSLKMDLNLKTKGQVLNGYTQLIDEGLNPETNVLSRARLGMNAYFNQLETRIAFQDTGIWGNRTSINKNGNVDVFEAWAKYNFSPNIYVKVGRQVLSYDNERLIGETDWAMAGRSFDAVKLGFTLGKDSQLETVVTYNNDGKKKYSPDGKIIYDILDGAENTKSMQLVHFKTKFDNTNFSAIALNNVVQMKNGTHHLMTTVGINAKHIISSDFNITGFAYYQFGKNTTDQKKSAIDISLDFNLQATPFWATTLGGEILSGTSYTESVDKNTSFSPLYGTNHKFNGYMDYFYSGNHFNGFGLNDFYLKNNFDFKKYGKLGLNLHYFMTQANWSATENNNLGTEVDLVYSKYFAKSFLFNVGYSQMFDTDNMKTIKMVPNAKSYQSFAWIGLSFTPQFKLK